MQDILRSAEDSGEKAFIKCRGVFRQKPGLYDVEQQPDCSGDYSIEVMPDQFAFTEDGDDEQAMKRTRHTNKEKERKDRIKNDIQEIRSLLPPLYTSDKKQTHHELLQNAITFIRVLIGENKELTTSCRDLPKDLEYNKLRKENEELKVKNKQYRHFLEAVGIPEAVDLSQLEVSWKLRNVASDSEACAADCHESTPTNSLGSGDQSVKEEENACVVEPNDSKEAGKPNGMAETTSDLDDESVYISADDTAEESGTALTSGDVLDVVEETQGSVAVVSSVESQQSVFMSPDSGSDRQAEMEKTVSAPSERLPPPSQSNGNLSDISEPASDTECSDGPLLAVSRLALENAFRQTGMLDAGAMDGQHKTVPEVTLKQQADDRGSSIGLLHGGHHVVSMSEEDGQRYMQMMQQHVSYSAHLSNGPVEPMLGLSCNARFGPPSTCPISPNISEPTTTGLGQMNNVMMLPSGQLVLVSPQHAPNNNMHHTSEPGVGPMLSGGTALTLAPPARQDNGGAGLQHAQQTGLFTTNFNLPGVNSGLTLGAHAVSGMPTVSTNNTLFMNPSVQYGMPHQQSMAFISNGQSGNVLPLMQPSCPSVSHLTVGQNQAMTVNMQQGPVTLNTLQQQATHNQHPSALILPNGQIVPVVTQPNLLFPQQQCTPVTGGLLMPSVPNPGLNIIGNIQNQQSQLRFGPNLLPTSTIQPTQVITNIANIRTPTYGLLQNTNQTNQQQQQYQLVGNSLHPIGNMNNGGILLSQPRQKDSFTIKNMATSLSGLALPQNQGQFTLLQGNCINAISSQHLNTSGLFGGSCSTTMSTAVPLLQAKPNAFGSTAALSNIPATLTAMLTPEGSIILAIPGCRDGELSAAGTNLTMTSKGQKATPRPLMPKPASKLDGVVGQLAQANAPLSSSKVCPSMMPCDFGTPGSAVSATSSPMVPLTVNTTTNMDFGCILSGPSSTASSTTDILAKATKSIFSISPYEHLSPRSSFNSGISDNLFMFSSAGLPPPARADAVHQCEGRTTTAAKPKRSKTKVKSVKKKSVKNAVCGLASLPDICHHIVHPHEAPVSVEMSPQHAIVDQLGNDEEQSDINDFSDLIRMEPMSPVTPKAPTTTESEPSSDRAIEKHEVMDVTDLTDDLTESSEKGGVLEIRSDSGIAEINQRTPEFDFINLKSEDKPDKSKDTPSFSISEVATAVTTEMSVSLKRSECSDLAADALTATAKDLPPVNEPETTLCREVGTSTERKRKKHRRQKMRPDADFSLVKEGKQDLANTDCKKSHSNSSNKHEVMDLLGKAFAPTKEDESSVSVKFGASEKVDVTISSSSSSAAPGLNRSSSTDKPAALTEDMCASVFKRESNTASSSRKSVNGLQLHGGKLEEETQTSKAELHGGGSHTSRSGLGGKKSRKRSHKSPGFIKAEMLPDMLMFTESELMDVVDKVENMMVTDERDTTTRKRLHSQITSQEMTVSENSTSVKQTKSDERLEAISVETPKEVSPREMSDQLYWPLISSTAEVPTDQHKKNVVVVPEMPSCLCGFEMEEEEMVGFGVTEAFPSSDSPAPVEANKESVASPAFTLDLVVPDIAERSPAKDVLEEVVTKQLDCSQNHSGDLQDVVEKLLEPTPMGSRQPSPDGPEQTTENDDDCVLETLPSIPAHASSTSVACTASQARHSGIVSLAKQVAPSKHQGHVIGGVQPKAGMSKHTARISQGNQHSDSDAVTTTSGFSSSSAPTTGGLDTYGENIFSGKDHFLSSSKDLGLDFSFELESKDKTSPCDVASAYDWVLADSEPPTSSTGLSISSPHQKQFDCEIECESSTAMKTCSASACNASLQPGIQSSSSISVGCTSVTHTTSSHHTLSSCASTYYASPSKTPTDRQPTPGYAQTTHSTHPTPSSGRHDLTAFGTVVSADIVSGLGADLAVATSGRGSLTCTTSTVVTLCHSLAVTSSNFQVRSSSGVNRSPMPVTPNATPCTALSHHKSSSLPSSSLICSSSAMKSSSTSCSNSSSRSSCSQKSSESHSARSSAMPLESTLSASSMYRSSSATDRLDRPSCSKEGPMRPNPDYFGAASQMSTSSSCAVQGKSLDDAFHYPLPPYVLNAASRDYGHIDGSLSRFSSTGNAAMLSSAGRATDYNALARCSLYFPTPPFTHDLGLDMTHQRMSPSRGLPSCSIEKHSSAAKVGSSGGNRLDPDGAKSCQARHQGNGYSGFPGSLMLSHNNQDIAQCSSHFIETRVANAHGPLAHNRDSDGVAAHRGNARLSSGGMQSVSASRSQSVSRSQAATNHDHSTTFALHSGGYTGTTSVVSSLASPPLHHHSAAPSDRHCLSQHLSYDLSFHAPAIQTFSPNLNGVAFDPPPLNFSRDCGGNASSLHHSKKTGKKADDHAGNSGSKMVLSHSKHQQQQQQSSAQQSHQSQPVKSSSGSSRSSRSSKKTVKTTTSAYDVDSSNMFENCGVTPYFGLGNISPNMNLPPDSLAYVNFFSNTGRPPLSNAAAKTLHHRDPPAPMTHPFNSSLFSPSRPQNGLGLNFQTGFGMDHMSSAHITSSSQMIIPHSGPISAHMHGFGFFPDISGSMVQRDALNNMPSMKFGPGAILPSQGGAEPSPLHHPQTAGSTMYNNRGQLPSHMLHDMGFNALLSHQHAAFDARSISGGMVHPPFGSHSHAASFGMGPLNFPVHNL